jgi:hypothetical protein
MQYLGRVSASEELWLLTEAASDTTNGAMPQRLVVWHNAGEVRVLAEFSAAYSRHEVLVSPSTDRVAFARYATPTVVVGVANGEAATFDPDHDGVRDCEDIGWYDELTLVRSCVAFSEYDEVGSLEKYSVWGDRPLGEILTYDTAAGEHLDFGHQAVRVGGVIIHPMGVPAADFTCPHTPFYVSDNGYASTGWVAREGEPQNQYFILNAVHRKAYAITVGSCPSEPNLRELSVLDTDTNSATVIFPKISLERGERPETSGLTSVIVGTR